MISPAEAREWVLPFAQEIGRCGRQLKKIPEAEYPGGNISTRLPEDLPEIEGGKRVPLGSFYFSNRQNFLVTKSGCPYGNINPSDPWPDLVLIQTEAGVSPFYRLVNLSAHELKPTRELLAHLRCYQAWQQRQPSMGAVVHYHPVTLWNLTKKLNERQLRDFYDHQPEFTRHLPEGFGYVKTVYEAGETQLAIETGVQMQKRYRVVIWNQHGPIVIEQDLDRALKLIELFGK